MTIVSDGPVDRLPPAAGSERRAAVRYPCRVRVYYQQGVGKLDGFWWRGTVCDISTDGLGLLLRQRFEPGTLLAVEMPTLPRQCSRTLGARVARVTCGPDGNWVTGCALVEKLDAESVSSVGS